MHFLAQAIQVGIGSLHIPALCGDVGGSRSVAVFAAVAGQLRCFFGADVAAGEGGKSLRLPAGDVATEAFGIELPWRIEMHERIQGMGVRSLLPDGVGFGVTFTAGLRADELIAAGMSGGPDP